MTGEVLVRAMLSTDIDAVMAVQAGAYPAHFLETETTIRARLQACPLTAWVGEDSEGVCAYLVAYPSCAGNVTPFNAVFAAAPHADCLYLHDLAVAPRASGRNAGTTLVGRALQFAAENGLAWSALVSVQSSAPYWERLGYRQNDRLDARQHLHLQSYAGEAIYMCRSALTG